ncbi:uncharacterized protein LOC110021909 [Phalaenopsis equestris]|uniref:uncharacterized protein LOC110021909 n=1 Tax=Phalaenopsis equestris TaxID=78828 RepID=UPI0009E56C82|nr:uncharacterized protein LOC110021909 [Phalaenopsis equestris]
METEEPVIMETEEESTMQAEKPKKKEGKERKKKESEEGSSRFVNPRSISSRCRPSVVRDALDKVRLVVSDGMMNELKTLNVDQFFALPPYPQDNVVTLQILQCWIHEKMVFRLGGKELRINPDEVALLVGMPNRGEVPKWKKVPSCGVDARQMKADLLTFGTGESSAPFNQLYINYLLSNLFFPSSNFSVSKGLYIFGENVDTFASFNWPAALCEYLIEQINAVAIKIRRNRPLGYINGFLFLLTVSTSY